MAIYVCDKCGGTQGNNKFGICVACGAMALTAEGE